MILILIGMIVCEPFWRERFNLCPVENQARQKGAEICRSKFPRSKLAILGDVSFGHWPQQPTKPISSVFLKRVFYSSKREIHNNMNPTNIKYLRCNMDCHLCGERHGSGADELLERLEGTQRAQRCALKRLTNQFWLGQTFVRTLANCQALYCGAPIITASDCQRCNSQSAAGDEICIRKVHIQFPATSKVMKHQICMMCSPSPAAFQRRGAQKICIWKLLSCWQWQSHPHRAHRGYLLRRQDDVSALWSLAPSPKNRWPSHYRPLPGCQQIESLVPTLLRLLLSRWDREDFCLGKPMMLLIRWVEAWWGYWWMLPEWWLSFSLFAKIIKHVFWKYCASSFFGISCYLV